jgi:deoxyuridine 5'-triphosphate nucleotidohydrolase
MVKCEFLASPKCRVEWITEERLVNETRANNAGRIICMFCSRQLKSTGRNNPNCIYRDVDDYFFERLDTEAKAYLLGWIASDGAIQNSQISIYVHRKDTHTLARLRDIVSPSLPLKHKKKDLVGFTLNSTRIVEDVCRWLEIAPGKKDSAVGFPELGDERLRWAFVRGLFDGDGSISSVDAAMKRKPKGGWPSPRCTITSGSSRMREGVATFAKIPCYRGKNVLEWNGTNALDFLGKLYQSATISLARKHDRFLDWCSWVPGMNGPAYRGRHPLFRWTKTLANAVPPSKEATSDSGFDLTLVARGDARGSVEFFRTGIKIQPDFGWYFDLVPRSSISKTGYMLANGVGVIDRAYVGEILVPLIKIDPNSPDLQLPIRLVQIIPRPIIAAQLIEVDELEGTARGVSGFGSTGR